MTPPPTLRVVLASYASYAEAERAVNLLAQDAVPITDVSIVAADLSFVERITGRRRWTGAAGDGALYGAPTGGLIGFVLGLVSPIAPLATGIALAIWGFVVGAIIGAFIGLVRRQIIGRRRDVASVGALNAGRYEVVVSPESAERAHQLLASANVGRAA